MGDSDSNSGSSDSESARSHSSKVHSQVGLLILLIDWSVLFHLVNKMALTLNCNNNKICLKHALNNKLWKEQVTCTIKDNTRNQWLPSLGTSFYWVTFLFSFYVSHNSVTVILHEILNTCPQKEIRQECWSLSSACGKRLIIFLNNACSQEKNKLDLGVESEFQ